MPTTHPAPGLEAGLASELRLAVMRLRRRLASERHPDNCLSMNAMAVLGALFRQGEQTVGELAVHERVQPPSMTRMVNSLEADGYVARRPHDSDGRQVLVALTEHGRVTLLHDRERRDEWLEGRLASLSEEDREVLHRAAPLLERLAKEA